MEICSIPVLSKKQDEAPRLIGVDDLLCDAVTTLLFEDSKDGKSSFKVSFRRKPTITLNHHRFEVSREKMLEAFSLVNCKYTDLHLCEVVKETGSHVETLRFANCKVILDMNVEPLDEVVLIDGERSFSGRSISEVMKYRQDTFISRC